VNGTAQDEITAYVDAVRDTLADLPADTRQELLDDLPEHLAEVLADGEGSLVDQLGTPQAYAAELRGAAGLVGGFAGRPAPDRFARLRETVRKNLHAADVRVGPLLGYEHASEFLHLLRPAWWVVRGYLVAMVLARVLDDSGQPIGLLPRIGGSEAVAFLLLAAAVLGSIWLGRRSAPLAPWPRYALRSGTVLLVLVALTGFLDADSSTRGSSYQDVRYDNPYGEINDVYVYDGQGRLLTGVRLFDQNGQPIRLGNPWCEDMASEDGSWEPRPAWETTYPYCPQNAPFRMPSADDPSPSGPAAPSPSSSVVSPSPSVRSEAPPVRSATPVVPTPTTSR
jgi:hypothetical protein